MKEASILTNRMSAGLSVLAGLTLCLHAPLVAAQSSANGQITKTVVEKGQSQNLQLSKRAQTTYDTYILGPGDRVNIELLDLPELSGNFLIGPDGALYLPRLRGLYVEGLTVEELRHSLTKEFSTYVIDPQVYVRPNGFRPIRVYVSGEVKRPGYYTLSGVKDFTNTAKSEESKLLQLRNGFPTVFDAIRIADGITPYTDLAQVQVIRKRAEGLGGGRIKTNLNFLSLITEGDESQNIRLFDGDVLNIGKSDVVLREQLLKSAQSNLNPRFVNVFVTGRVNVPGEIKVPQGSSLNQAISLAGGAKLLKGKVEFVRLNREGTIDRRIFTYRPGAAAAAPNNPILATGDLIRIRDSIASGSVTVLNEITGPFVGLYSVYSLFNGIAK